MLDPIIKGSGLGLIIAIMVGPVFFFILNTSIKRGFAPAAITAIGVLMSDVFFILLAYFGSSFILYLNDHKDATGVIGGIVIGGFGTYLFFKEARVSAEPLEFAESPHPRILYLVKGFMLNLVNPSVLLFWFVVASTIPVKEQFTPADTFVFYSFTLGTVLCTDLIKAYLANRLKTVITAKSLIILNRIAGIALVIYGGSMIVRVILESIK
jgi:threonine/homoserine/homoserine lactone efflux protein